MTKKEIRLQQWNLAKDAKNGMTIDQLEKEYKMPRGDIYTALIDVFKFYIIDNRAFTKMTDEKLNHAGLKHTIKK